MPVLLPSEEDTVGQFNRLSASQVNTYNNCARMWWFEKKIGLKIPDIPALHRGKAVERAFCMVLRENPALIISTAPTDVFDKVPLDQNGLPDRRSEDGWPAQFLLPLPVDMRPSSIEELNEWAKMRLELHLKRAIAEEKELWERNPRKTGDWEQGVGYESCFNMCLQALEWHLEEVEQCLKEGNEEIISKWRSGEREFWPSPDGYPYKFRNTNPLACDGELTICEAWAITRPWFVDPSAENFAMNAVVPESFFMGEYDLVYRWDGRTRIIDLKASSGNNFRSEDYVSQMEMYAMLWWATHDKEILPDDLEIWYVGAGVKKAVQVPEITKVEQMFSDLNEMWKRIKSEDVKITDCPPNPRALRKFSDGGKEVGEDNLSRCEVCEWSYLCPKGGSDDEYPETGAIQLPGSSNALKIEDIGDLNPRISVVAEVFTCTQKDGRPPFVRVTQNNLFANLQFNDSIWADINSSLEEEISKGQTLLIEDVCPSANWKGEVALKFDPHSKLSIVSEDEPERDSIVAGSPRVDVSGRIAYFTEKRGVNARGEWKRRGVVLINDKGKIHVEGWDNQFPATLEVASPGDEVIVTNLGLEVWAVLLKGALTKYSEAHITRRWN